MKLKQPLRVLVACEMSGVVREAFRALGHDAWSCDILPSEIPGHHLQGDVAKWLSGKPPIVSTGNPLPWDLIIGHPPCTFLCNSGVRWLAPGGKMNHARHQKMMLACDFLASIYWAPCEHVCIENPIMHRYARDYLASTWKIPKFSQTIQPWQHGCGETKRTGLWLRGLPDINPTKIVSGREARIHKMSSGPNQAQERSRTYSGIAAAMAAQWSKHLTTQSINPL